MKSRLTIHTLTQPRLQLIENKLKCPANPLKAAIHITDHKKEIKNIIKQHIENPNCIIKYTHLQNLVHQIYTFDSWNDMHLFIVIKL